MFSETYSNFEKIEISKKIKNITFEQINNEMEQLIKIGVNACNMSPRCRIGNNIVDYFTFTQRLNTKGKYNINYFEFIYNIDEFKKKKIYTKYVKLL